MTIPKKILVCGDSFATDHSVNDPVAIGWSSMLANLYDVTNCAQAGVSEYKIIEQIKNQNLNDYDAIIISHTSPYRVYIKEHPVYQNNNVHKYTDLIYNDVLHHYNINSDNILLESAKNYFENIFDENYYQELYYMMIEQIKKLISGHRCLHLLTIFDQGVELDPVLNLKTQFRFKQGTPNHYSYKNNVKICNLVAQWINTGYV
jgi:hypothetical protein